MDCHSGPLEKFQQWGGKSATGEPIITYNPPAPAKTSIKQQSVTARAECSTLRDVYRHTGCTDHRFPTTCHLQFAADDVGHLFVEVFVSGQDAAFRRSREQRSSFRCVDQAGVLNPGTSSVPAVFPGR